MYAVITLKLNLCLFFYYRRITQNAVISTQTQVSMSGDDVHIEARYTPQSPSYSPPPTPSASDIIN